METKKRCTKCKESKELEYYPIDQRHTDGRKSQCKKCVNAHGQKKYLERHISKMPPILLSWQPKPGDRFKAYLLGRNWCVLSPFVCVRNDVTAVISTSEGRSWKLEKSEYIFGRTN